MPENISDKRRVAKNTILLYVRMILVIIVGLYTSRVVLDTLGVSDYGVYNVVGGVVAMLAFFNSALTAASQRFISYELGIGDTERLKKIFCTSVFTHATLAGVVFIIAETAGLWFVNTHLNIEPDRMTAANWVYQCSIFTFVLTILSVPYNSCIVAHEHMQAFAYVSIIEVVLKLLIVYLLFIINGDRLIVYSILVFLVALFIRITYGIYCKKHFQECTYKLIIDKQLFKEMFSFAGWSVVGNLGFSFKDQVSNIILNIFFGTLVNAARGVALQVNGIISNFSNNFMMAMNPQITKLYASGDIKSSIDFVYTGSRYSFFLLLIIAVPVIINIDYLLGLWLVSVPEYTSEFLTLALIAALINSMSISLVTALQATGNIKVFQITICIVMLCELPLAYLILKLGGQPYMAMYPTIAVTFIGLFARFIILKKMVPEYDFGYFAFRIVGKNLLIGAVCLIISGYIHNLFKINFMFFVLTSVISCGITILLVYSLGMSNSERQQAQNKLYNLLRIRR